MKNLHILQQESIDEGRLQVRVRQKNMGTPVADAKVSVSYSGDPQGKIEETDTNESGSIEAVEIATPPLEYSMSPSESQPYSEVTVTVSANGYRNITVSGVEVMPDRLSIQDIELEVLDAPGNDVDNIVIPAHTLYGDYPAKIPEPEIMPVAETGEIVLNRVVIPEYVIVHDGAPSDSTAALLHIRSRQIVFKHFIYYQRDIVIYISAIDEFVVICRGRLGDQGYSAIEILRYFYGSNMYINTAEAVSGIPASWPGYNIGIGSSGQNVYQIQKQLAASQRHIRPFRLLCRMEYTDQRQRRLWKNFRLYSAFRYQEWWITIHGMRYQIYMSL